MIDKPKARSNRIPKTPEREQTKTKLPRLPPIGNRLRFFEQGAIERQAARKMIEQFEKTEFKKRLVSIAPIQRAFIETILERHGITSPKNIPETIIPESAHTNDIRRRNLIRIAQETHENLKQHLTEEERKKIAHYFHESNVKALKRLFKKLEKYHVEDVRKRSKQSSK